MINLMGSLFNYLIFWMKKMFYYIQKDVLLYLEAENKNETIPTSHFKL